jgi:hypothetical protein
MSWWRGSSDSASVFACCCCSGGERGDVGARGGSRGVGDVHAVPEGRHPPRHRLPEPDHPPPVHDRTERSPNSDPVGQATGSARSAPRVWQHRCRGGAALLTLHRCLRAAAAVVRLPEPDHPPPVHDRTERSPNSDPVGQATAAASARADVRGGGGGGGGGGQSNSRETWRRDGVVLAHTHLLR